MNFTIILYINPKKAILQRINFYRVTKDGFGAWHYRIISFHINVSQAKIIEA